MAENEIRNKKRDVKGNVHIPFFRQNLSDRAVLYLFNYVGTLKMYELFQIVKRHFDLPADLSAAETEGRQRFCGVMHGGGEEFLHADRGTAAVNISGQWEQIL